jgi:3-oxoacyl-[acyl-carrier protein] reductase
MPYPSYPDLQAKVAVVTGGSRGIGAATCRLLAANGVKVVVNGRHQAAISPVVTNIQSAGGRAVGITADCTNFAAIERMRQRTQQELGPVDVLVACVGGYGEYTPTDQLTEEQWRLTVDANLTSTFLTLKSFLPGMIDRRQGSIITVASSAARFLIGASSASAAYAAAKAGVVMLARRVASEVGKYGVRVNCVAPAAVLTERVEHHMSEAEQKDAATLVPLGRMGTPDDVALAILFLASDSSSWLTGVTLDVAGGRIML